MNQREVVEYPEDLGPVFHAQLEVMAQLIRNALSGNDSAGPEVFRSLHAERRQLLRKQARDLGDRTDPRGYRDPVALSLRSELGMEPSDATLVAWCFSVERSRSGQHVNPHALMVRIGAAYVSLFRGPDTFLPPRRLTEQELLPLAVAVSAVRTARTRGDASSTQVESLVRKIVEILSTARE